MIVASTPGRLAVEEARRCEQQETEAHHCWGRGVLPEHVAHAPDHLFALLNLLTLGVPDKLSPAGHFFYH
jgi:hypothetical protein